MIFTPEDSKTSSRYIVNVITDSFHFEFLLVIEDIRPHFMQKTLPWT